MAYVFANNAFSFLTADIDAQLQDITVRVADADLFPNPEQGRGDVFMVTLEDRQNNRLEVAECFRRNGATLSLRRGREGTTARAFIAGTTVSNRLTAKVIEAGLQGWAEFNRRYLGAYATPPTVDAMGYPIHPGAMYYDLNTDSMAIFTKDGWIKWSPSGDLQTGLPPGGAAGHTLTRTSTGTAEWREMSDLSARDSAERARTAADAAATAANAANVNASSRVSAGGGTMTGTLTMRGTADTAGNITSRIFVDKAGPAGRAMIHFGHEGVRRRSLILGSDNDNVTLQGGLGVAAWDASGNVIGIGRIALHGEVLANAGGEVQGDTTFKGITSLLGLRNYVHDLHLRPISVPQGFGGRMIIESGTAGVDNNIAFDVVGDKGRFYGFSNQVPMMHFHLHTGDAYFWKNLEAQFITSRERVVAQDIMMANGFRFVQDVGTGITYSGTGHGTLLSGGQGVLQWRPDRNVFVWGNVIQGSDERLKEDIHNIHDHDAMRIVRRLQGVYYKRKDDQLRREQVGFIAQEVQEVLPQAVSEDREGVLGVNYQNMVALLAEAAKDLDKRLHKVEAAIG